MLHRIGTSVDLMVIAKRPVAELFLCKHEFPSLFIYLISRNTLPFLPAMAPIGGVTVSGNNDSQNKHSNSSSKSSSRSGSSVPGGGDSTAAANGVHGAKDAATDNNNRLWAKLLTEGEPDWHIFGLLSLCKPLWGLRVKLLLLLGVNEFDRLGKEIKESKEEKN